MKTPNEVHAYLALRYGRGYVSILARKLTNKKRTVTKHMISKTINGRQMNEETRAAIATDSNMPVEEFFEPEFDVFVGLKEKAVAA